MFRTSARRFGAGQVIARIILALAGSALFGATGPAGGASADSAPASEIHRIEDAHYVKIGGLDQWVTVRGDLAAGKPLLLIVHGGPGDVLSPFGRTFAPYESGYIVVQWDQRGSGRTFARHGEATPNLSLDRLVADGIELSEYLRARFPGRKLVLLGHSWGTVIATGMARSRPDLFGAYVGTGQIASWAASVNWQFDFLLQRAREANDREAVAKLEAIGRPDPQNVGQFFEFSRPIRGQMGEADKEWLSELKNRALAAGETEKDILAAIGGMDFSGHALIEAQSRVDLARDAKSFNMPYCVIQGRDDLFTPTQPALDYFGRVEATSKRFSVIEGAGHFAMMTHASEFIAQINACLGNAGNGPSA